MKKLLFLFLLTTQCIQAQDSIPKSPLLNKRNEIRVDVLALALARPNITFERFFSKSFSAGVSGIYSNTKKVKDDFDEGNINAYSKYEIIPFVRYNLSQGARSFYFAEVFANANGGDFRETVLLFDEFNNNYYEIKKSQYADFAIGGSLGYKFYFKDRIGVELLVGFGKNLIDIDKSPDILSRVGLSLGYRF